MRAAGQDGSGTRAAGRPHGGSGYRHDRHTDVVRLLATHAGSQQRVAAVLGLNPVTVGRIARKEGYVYPKAQPSARARTGRKLQQPERAFQAQVMELAARLGWRTYHTWMSIHSAAGFPDCVVVRPPRVVFAEIKREGGKPTAAQAAWLAALGACPGVETYLWQPSDWDAIVATLSAGGPR